MKPQSPKLKSFHKFIRGLIREALANKFGQGGDIETAEAVANSHWGSVYNVMPKGEAKNEVFYRVQLHNSSGPVKYLKQDSLGRWYFMEPPALQWRPVNPAKVPTAEPTNEDGERSDIEIASSETSPLDYVKCPKCKQPNYLCRCDDEMPSTRKWAQDAVKKECSTCGCDDPNDTHDELPDAMNGDTTDVHTMDTANLGEAVNYRASTDELIKAFVAWKHSTPSDIKSHNAVAFTAGYNACLAVQKQTGLNEMTTSGAVFSGGPTIQTPYAFSKKGGGSKKAMDATKKTGYKPVKKEY